MQITAKIKGARVSRIYPGSIVGTIKGDKKGRFADGTHLLTSDVQRVLVVTLNSVYEIDLSSIKKTALPFSKKA